MDTIHVSTKFPFARYCKYSKLIAGVVLSGALSAWAGTIPGIVVPGTSDPYLAGMPDGSTASYDDVAPAQSPVLVPSWVPQAGDVITFSNVTGLVNYDGDTPNDPPDGAPNSILGHLDGNPGDSPQPENGIADMYAPIDSLVGVFLGSGRPDTGDPTPPPPLDFSPTGSHPNALGLNFLTLSPLLYQPFFIGDGMTSGKVVQQFTVPAGATRLYLGTMDGFDWENNTGAFSVDLNVPETVPEPASFSLLALAGGTLLLRRRRHNEARGGCSA
ncbi:MAG: PEP-CTERM sorting domain-containing protein [Tepidisphaeraceae bacterium]|jgi:hypothetical protein